MTDDMSRLVATSPDGDFISPSRRPSSTMLALASRAHPAAFSGIAPKAILSAAADRQISPITQ
jgi:hypothetical protein